MRASGILLPVFSLPSRYGIGCFSKEAYTFAEQLARAGQRYWQILPLGPTGYGIPRISLSPPLPETRILSTWILWPRKVCFCRRSTRKFFTGKRKRALITGDFMRCALIF